MRKLAFIFLLLCTASCKDNFDYENDSDFGFIRLDVDVSKMIARIHNYDGDLYFPDGCFPGNNGIRLRLTVYCYDMESGVLISSEEMETLNFRGNIIQVEKLDKDRPYRILVLADILNGQNEIWHHANPENYGELVLQHVWNAMFEMDASGIFEAVMSTSPETQDAAVGPLGRFLYFMSVNNSESRYCRIYYTSAYIYDVSGRTVQETAEYFRDYELDNSYYGTYVLNYIIGDETRFRYEISDDSGTVILEGENGFGLEGYGWPVIYFDCNNGTSYIEEWEGKL